MRRGGKPYACGLPLACSWVDGKYNHNGSEPSVDARREHSVRCVRLAADADILLLFDNGDDERQFGSLIEATATLASGGQVFLVSANAWPSCATIRAFDHTRRWKRRCGPSLRRPPLMLDRPTWEHRLRRSQLVAGAHYYLRVRAAPSFATATRGQTRFVST
jgi:hypothetical protein